MNDCSALNPIPRRLVGVVFTFMMIWIPLSAGAADNHTSAWVLNNGCKWRGHHNFGTPTTQIVTATTTEDAGQSCAEVAVKVRWGAGDVWDWDAAFAEVRISYQGANNLFVHSDHNADPVGPPPYVGFRMT